MNIVSGVLIGNKWCFLTNPALMCATMMAAFVLDAMPVNATCRSTSSNVIVDEHPELWPGVRLRIMDDLSCYELWVILTATGTSVKCRSPKSFLSLKAFLKLSFNRITPAHMFQGMFKPSFE